MEKIPDEPLQRPPEMIWREAGPNYENVSVSSEAGYLQAIVDKNQSRLFIENFELKPEKRGQGLGTEYLQSLAIEARNRGVKIIFGEFISKAVIRVLIKTFGEENIFSYDLNTKNLSPVNLGEIMRKEEPFRIPLAVEL
jgi:GNAT superfamily N-acetyltransferase